MPDRHVHRLRVRYAECDAQGVVFNAHYLAYFDIGLTELWRRALGSYQAMVDGGADVTVAQATVRYRRPARFDDEVDVEARVVRFGTTSMGVEFRLTRDRELLAEGEIAYVFVDSAGAKLPVPEWIREALEPDCSLADGTGATAAPSG
jgi:acyl-CoA thioester hydrolase